MELEANDVHAMLQTSTKCTPEVPKTDRGSPQTPNSTESSESPELKIPQNVIVVRPSAAVASDDPDTNITIHNCVATVDLNTGLDLIRINARTRNSEFNPIRFHGLIMRLTEPRTTALIFRTGKIVCTGAKCEQDALLASKKFARIIQKLGFNIKFNNFKIQNLVATYNLRFPIKLEELSNAHAQFCNYEPELFPGIIYRMIKPRLSVMIFVNGKLVFTGAKSRNDIKEALDYMYPILCSFRKKHTQ